MCNDGIKYICSVQQEWKQINIDNVNICENDIMFCAALIVSTQKTDVNKFFRNVIEVKMNGFI